MSFTIHDIDRELDDRLAKRARQERISKNQLVKRLLAKAVGLRTNDRKNDEYREFLGRWSEEERNAFGRRQAGNERIDNEEWT